MVIVKGLEDAWGLEGNATVIGQRAHLPTQCVSSVFVICTPTYWGASTRLLNSRKRGWNALK